MSRRARGERWTRGAATGLGYCALGLTLVLGGCATPEPHDAKTTSAASPTSSPHGAPSTATSPASMPSSPAGAAMASAAATSSATGAPEYLQLRLALFDRTGMKMRIHLRFTNGDDSFNYLRAGKAYVGRFRDPRLADKGRALVARECKTLAEGLEPVSLATAQLRPEDSAAFMGKLMKGEDVGGKLTDPASAAKVEVACAEPGGGAWVREVEHRSVEQLDARWGPLIAALVEICDEAAASSAAK